MQINPNGTVRPNVNEKSIVLDWNLFWFYCLYVCLSSGETVLVRCVQIGGHSAGGHLAACMFDHLVRTAHPHVSIVKSLHLIAGVYDLGELRHSSDINPDNILSITDANCRKLSPYFFDYTAWKAITSGTDFIVHLYIGDTDAPKLAEHTHEMHSIFARNRCASQLIILNGFDHFNIVEQLSDGKHEIVAAIVSEADRLRAGN